MQKKTVVGMLAMFSFCTSVQAHNFSNIEICKAAIAVEMGRDAKTMKTRQADPMPEISYQRDDGNTFLYRCNITERQVVWSTFLTDTNEWGRWRNSYEAGDATTTFFVTKGVLRIVNDQAGEEPFSKKDF
jgi:hypothetical protein